MPKEFKTKNPLPAADRKKVIALLNERLADAVDLVTQAKQAHWNVKGTDFFELHELFDKVYEAAEEAVDLIAERAVQLGGVALGTARIAAKNSTLKEYPTDISESADHVAALSDRLSAFGKKISEAIETTDQLGDAGTADMLTDIVRAIDKMLWFVEAHQQ